MDVTYLGLSDITDVRVISATELAGCIDMVVTSSGAKLARSQDIFEVAVSSRMVKA